MAGGARERPLPHRASGRTRRLTEPQPATEKRLCEREPPVAERAEGCPPAPVARLAGDRGEGPGETQQAKQGRREHTAARRIRGRRRDRPSAAVPAAARLRRSSARPRHGPPTPARSSPRRHTRARSRGSSRDRARSPGAGARSGRSSARDRCAGAIAGAIAGSGSWRTRAPPGSGRRVGRLRPCESPSSSVSPRTAES